MKYENLEFAKRYIYYVFFFLLQTTYGQNKHLNDYNQGLRIPVSFHMVHKTPTEENLNISIEKLEILIAKINKSFNEVNVSEIDPQYQSIVASCNISFYIPNKDENCQLLTDVISWHKTDESYFENEVTSRKKLKKHGFLDDDKFLNIWVCELKGEPGFATYPESDAVNYLRKEGVVLDYNFINKSNISPIIHEIGHYLNLSHIWEEAKVNDPNNYSCKDDDGILDTPQQAGPNYRGRGDAGPDNIFQFNEIQKACEDSTRIGNYQNYMDYAYEAVSMFTTGQKDKMRETILNKRSGLLWKSECNEEIIVSTRVPFIDKRDGKRYNFTPIGRTRWMTSNLEYATPNSICYSNKDYNCSIYGRLYTWGEAINACPNGWRLPTSNDWKEMVEYIKYDLITIKSKEGWIRKNGNNARSLNILPSGNYTVARQFRGLGQRASFWLADDLGNNTNRNSRTIRDGVNQIPTSGIHFAREKLSCRCVQDI